LPSLYYQCHDIPTSVFPPNADKVKEVLSQFCDL